MNNDEEQQSAQDDNNEMSYFDRVVFEAGGTADDIKESAILEGEQGGENDDVSIWSEANDLDATETSDEEMEYDSDEDSVQNNVQLIRYSPNRENNTTSEVDLSEESKQLLLWRLEKDESFSDWTIEVSIANKRKSRKAYHVHKTTLGLGPKKSGYFEALLTSGQFSESSINASVAVLPEDTAKYFDVFLDYLYASPHDCACLINRDNRGALQYLANYFLVSKLQEDIYAFIEKDMIDNMDNVNGYLAEIESSEDEKSSKILAIAGRALASNILLIRRHDSSPFVFTLSPALFLHIMSVVRVSKDIHELPCHDTGHICTLAIDYIKHHQTELDANYFATLVSELYFPDDTNIAGNVAICLLELAESNGWAKDCSCGSASWVPSVLDICTAILSRYLLEMPVSSQALLDKRFYQKLPKDIICRLLAITLSSKKEMMVLRDYTISCKLMTNFYNRAAGSIVEISIKTTDTVDYIRYLLGRELNSATLRIGIMCNRGWLRTADEFLGHIYFSFNRVTDIPNITKWSVVLKCPTQICIRSISILHYLARYC